jgi:hypothetical protein
MPERATRGEDLTVLSWLVDNSFFLCVLFLVVAWGFFALWWRTRQRHYLIGIYVSAPLAILFGVLPYLGFSGGEGRKLEQVIRAMAAAARAHDIDRVFSHISQNFQHRGMSKEAFHRAVERHITGHDVDDVSVWDFETLDVSREARSGTLSFSVRVTGNWGGGREFYRCEATLVLDPDDHWRLREFEIFNPFVQTHEPIHIPF